MPEQLIAVSSGLRLPSEGPQSVAQAPVIVKPEIINPFADNASVADRAGVMVAALHDFGLVPDTGNEVTNTYTKHLKAYHAALVADAKPGDKGVETFWALDLDDEKFTFGVLKTLAERNNYTKVVVWPNLWGQTHLRSSQLNRRTMSKHPEPKPAEHFLGRVMGLLPGEGPDGLHAVGMEWDEQREYIKQVAREYPKGRHGRTGAFAIAPQDTLLINRQRMHEKDSANRVLLDPSWQTATRYVQHPRVEVEFDDGSRVSRGPGSVSGASLVDFFESSGWWSPFEGVRVLVGQVAAQS